MGRPEARRAGGRMLLGMTPPTPKERRQGFRDGSGEPKPRTKLKASPPARAATTGTCSGNAAPSGRRRAGGAPSCATGPLGGMGDMARRMGAAPATAARPKPRKPRASPTKASAAAPRRKPSLQRGNGAVLVPAHSPSPPPMAEEEELSPPVSETDSQSDRGNSADERELPSPPTKPRKSAPRSSPLSSPRKWPASLPCPSSERRGGRLRVNRAVEDGREMAAAAGESFPALLKDFRALSEAYECATAPPDICIAQVDASNPLEQAWARQTNSRFDIFRSLKQDQGVKRAPTIDWAAAPVIEGAWEHMGGKHEHQAREDFCAAMLAPGGAGQGSVSCPPGLQQVAPPALSSEAAERPVLSADEITDLLAAPRARMQKLHSSMTRMSYRALYPRTGDALKEEQQARLMDKAMATVQLLWPRSAARKTLVRKRQERADAAASGKSPDRADQDPSSPAADPDPTSGPKDLLAVEKKSTIETLNDRRERRLKKARAAAKKVKEEAAKEGIIFLRAKEEETRRIAQEEEAWRARQQADASANSGEAAGIEAAGVSGAPGTPVRKKYEGASAGESPVAAAARALLERAANRDGSTVNVEKCNGCGLAGSQLGRVDDSGSWLCQHCSVARPAAGAAPAPGAAGERRGSTGDFGGSSSIEQYQAAQVKRRPAVRRRPSSAAASRSAAAAAPPFTPPRGFQQAPGNLMSPGPAGSFSPQLERSQLGRSSSDGVRTDADAFTPQKMMADSFRQDWPAAGSADMTGWSVGVNGIGGSPKTSTELGFETRIRMMELVSGSGGDSAGQVAAQQAQASALAKTLMHRGATREEAERSAAKTVQSTSSGGWTIPGGDNATPAEAAGIAGGGTPKGKKKKKTRMRMRPQSAGVPARQMPAASAALRAGASVAFQEEFLRLKQQQGGRSMLDGGGDNSGAGELEKVMLETVGTLNAERGRLAEQLAWATRTGSSSGKELAERMHAAEVAVAAATHVLAQPRSDRSATDAQAAGGAMIDAARALSAQVVEVRVEQERNSPRATGAARSLAQPVASAQA